MTSITNKSTATIKNVLHLAFAIKLFKDWKKKSFHKNTKPPFQQNIKL